MPGLEALSWGLWMFCVCVMSARWDLSTWTVSVFCIWCPLQSWLKLTDFWFWRIILTWYSTIQAVIYNLRFYRWITWDVLKIWADLHGVLFHPQHCSNSAASDSAISNVANICPMWLLVSFISGEKFLCTMVGGCFFHRLDRACSLHL